MNDKEQIRMKLESRERVERMKNGGEDLRATLATEDAHRGKFSDDEYMSSREQQLRRQMEESKNDPYRGYGEDQRSSLNNWGRTNRSEEDIRKFSEEELKLRDETLRHTPSGHDSRYRIIGETYAPTTEGMKVVGDDDREQHRVYSDKIVGRMVHPQTDEDQNVAHKVHDAGGKTMQHARDMGNMVENKAKEMNEAHVVEHSAHRAGSTVGSLFSRAKVVARELTDGFREGYSKDKK